MTSKSVTPILVFVVAVLAVALFIRGGEVLTALSIASENSSQVTVTISPATPVCEGTTCYDADETTDYIDLVGGGTRQVKCNSTCTDQNGWGNMKNWTGNITNFTQPQCGPPILPSNTYCYVNTTCKNNSAINTTTQRVECTFNFWFNAVNTSKSGDWNFTLRVGDVDGLMNVPTSDTIDVSELLAIGVDSTIAFGSKSANANDSTTTVLDSVYNFGNIMIDFSLNASSLTCAPGTITAEYLHVNISNGGAYSLGYPLKGTLGGPDVNKYDVNLSANVTVTTQDPRPTNRSTYWGIGIPGAVGGACSGYVWFAALAS